MQLPNYLWGQSIRDEQDMLDLLLEIEHILLLVAIPGSGALLPKNWSCITPCLLTFKVDALRACFGPNDVSISGKSSLTMGDLSPRNLS